MKLSACATAMALAFGAAHAWTFDTSEVAPPEDIVGEHQPLQRTWTVSSFAQLEQLYLAVPGRVFVGLDPSLLPVTEAPSTEAPAKEIPGVVSGVTPGVVPGFIPGVEPGFVPGAVPAGSLGGSGSGLTTKAPSIEVPAKETPGVVSGVTPGVVPGFIPGAEPGFVPGAVPAGSLGGSGSGLTTKAPSIEVPAKETPSVVSGVTPGVVPGFIPGAEPGFVPGAVPAGSLGGSGSGLTTKAPSIEVPAKETPGVVSGVTPGVVPGFIPGAEPGFVPGAVPAGSLGGSGSGLTTKAPSIEVPAKETPGVVSGVTPGVVPGVIPGAVPGFVPGAVPAGSLGGSGSGLTTKAPSIEVPAKETPGVVSGVTPGVVPGFIPGAEPGFVPGAVPAGSLGGSGSGLTTKAPSIEVPAKETPGVVSGVTPGVVPGVIPGAVPGFVPGAVPAGSLGGSGSGLTTKAPSIEVPAKETPGVVSGVTPGVVPGFIPGAEPGFVPGAVPAGSLGVAGEMIEIPTMMLRKHHRKHENDDEQQGEETVVARIVITGNSTDLLNMIEAAPLHPRRNDGLKLHLKNEDAYGEGFVLTQIYLFEKNLLRRVTTAFSGDVVLNEDVVTLDNAEADVKLACVGDANLYLESSSNATLASLEVEVTGSGLVQLEIPSVNLEGSLDVEVAGSGSVALVTDALAAAEVKTTLSGSGNIIVDTSDLEAQKLDASVYGSGVSSFATAGAVDKETLTLSGPGQLLAGSIVARKSEVDVWGDGDMLVQVTDRLTVSTSVWGKVGYVNAPPTDVKIKGWWFWREASSIVYSATVNKVLIYEPVTVPAKYPVYYSIETAESALSDDPDYAFVSAEPSSLTNLMTTSLSSVQQAADPTTSDSNGLFYAFVGVGVVVVNVVAARSWAQRRARRHYTPLP